MPSLVFWDKSLVKSDTMLNKSPINDSWTVVGAYIETVLETIEGLGIPRAAILQKVGMAPDQLFDRDSYLPVSLMMDMFSAASEVTPIEDIGLHVAANIKPKSFGLLGYISMFSRTIGEGIETAISYGHIGYNLGEIKFIDLDNSAALYLHPHCEEFAKNRQLIDAKIGGLISMSKFELAEYHPPIKVCFSYPEPEDLTLLHEMLGENIDFDEPFSSIHFSKQWMSLPFVHADSDMRKRVCGDAQQLIQALGKSNSITVQVKKKIIALLPLQKANASLIADELHMTRRTLQRRLHAEGTHFHSLLQEARSQMALLHLRNSDLSILEVALLLGYTDHSSFTKAFKQWQKITPIEFRSSLA